MGMGHTPYTKGNYDLFTKADWNQYSKENDLTSIQKGWDGVADCSLGPWLS